MLDFPKSFPFLSIVIKYLEYSVAFILKLINPGLAMDIFSKKSVS